MFTVTGRARSRDLTRAELWDGLVRKAEDPIPFVRAITACRVLDRGDGWLEREIVLRGDVVRERVTFASSRDLVRFERLSGPVAGTIENRIEEDGDGRLALRFTFRLEVDGLAAGSRDEAAYAARMKGSYLAAIRSTIARVRRIRAEAAS